MELLADATYVLPIRRTAVGCDNDFDSYLEALVRLLPVIVVDGSPPRLFDLHAARWPRAVVHIPVDEDRRSDLNGKVAGVVTGLRRVRTSSAIIADDDVRYDRSALHRVAELLDDADVVRPQNVFEPTAWHTLLDSGRMLIARATGGDWPGTIGVRTAFFPCATGYDGNVLFENLELVRTLRARGARELVAYDVFVARRPPTVQQYVAQRTRQAYDEFARPPRLAAELAVAPLLALATRRFGAAALAVAALGAVALAELGRRRGDGQRAFPPLASALAPLWVAERAATAWGAVALRAACGGVRYSHGTLRTAANPERSLRRRVASDAARGMRAS